MRKIARVLQIIWLSPVLVLFWMLHVLPMWLVFRDLVWKGWAEYGIAEFLLARKLTPWYGALWGAWYGMGGPCVFICREPADSPELGVMRAHELEHCRQQFRWGVLFYPAYAVCSIAIYFCAPSLHPYYDNPFERGAREAAGQGRPTEAMRQARDRWPWW